MVGTAQARAFAHPQLARQKFKRIAIHGLPTLPRGGKCAETFPQNHGGRVFTELLAAMHPPRKNLTLPQEKNACRQFAARLAGRVDVRRGWFSRTGFKRLTRLRISYRAARTSFATAPWQPSQVLQSAKDFGCSETVRSP
jgi:hypothetical protein